MSVYGIDLGTTYSCLAKFEDGQAVIIQNAGEQSNSLPSAVFFESESSIVVGNEAKNMVQTDPMNVVQFIKREIGKECAPHEFFGQSFSAIDISAMILKKIKAYAADQGEDVKDVVITCPAYFGFAERDATRKAGELAGFNVLALINEPTAASISYAFRNGGGNFPEETVLIYDLGGGTFDVTVLHISSKEVDGKVVPHFEVLATDGDDKLGGKDWDHLLEALITGKVCAEAGIDEEELDEDDRAAIASKIEPTKKALTAKESHTFRAPIQGQTVKFDVTREEFETTTASLVQQTIDCVSRVLTKENVAGKTIDKILLVGGSSNMPMVMAAVKGAYPDTTVQLEEPELAVAKGAACYAFLLTQGLNEEGDNFPDPDNPQPEGEGEGAPKPKPAGFVDYVDDLTPRSFGIGAQTRDKATNEIIWICANLIKKDTVIGENTNVTKTFYVPYDGCEQINVPVYQNVSMADQAKPCTDLESNPLESDPADQMQELGRFVLNVPEGSREKRHPMIVNFQVDSAGVHVKVTDGVTNQELEGCDIAYNTGDFNQEESQQRIDAFEIVD